MSITDRLSARQTIENWLTLLHKTAKSERADHTSERIMSLSASFLALSANEDAAEPHKMSILLSRDDFPERQRAYIAKNAILLTGISIYETHPDKDQRRAYMLSIADEITSACAKTSSESGEMTELSGASIIRFSAGVSALLMKSNMSAESNIYMGNDVETLIREAIGMPGDWAQAERITDPQTLLNAGLALRALGVSVSENAVNKLRDPETSPSF